ncbi:hypothetical protein WDW37_13450 [Bdellovibrionota bacterium FG-1]
MVAGDIFAGDFYIDDPYQDCKFRFEKVAGKVYARPYGEGENEIRQSNSCFCEALSAGKVITKEEYYRD